MAGPLDISTYAGGAGSIPEGVDPEVLRRIQAARDAARAAAAAAGQPGVVPPAAAAEAALTEAAPTRFSRLRNILNPNITVKGLAKLGKGGLALAPVVGGVQSAFDTPEAVADIGDSVGIDASTGAGRFGANVVNFLNNTGNAATFGLAGRVGRLLAGGSFFDPVSGAEVKPTGNPAASDAGGLYPPTATPANVVPRARLGAVSPVVQPVTGVQNLRDANDFIDSPAVPAAGTGFIRNNSTGAIQQFTRGATAAPVDEANKYGYADLISRIGTKRDKAAAAEQEFKSLTAQAALAKAMKEFNTPEKTEVVPSLDPTKAPTVVQVRNGVAKNLPVVKQLPPGYDAATAYTEAQATLKAQGNSKKVRDAVNARLAEYGLAPLK